MISTSSHPGLQVVIVNDVSVARGGATSLALLEARLLRERGIKVVSATGDAGESGQLEASAAPAIGLNEARLMQSGVGALVSGLYNRRTVEVFARRLREIDTPDTIYHVHGWMQILSPSLFAALAPFRDRVVVSAHDFFLACPNGAYANFRNRTTCPLTPLSLACLITNCDKRKYTHKLWRFSRQWIQRAVLSRSRLSPVVLAIHEGMREPLRRGGVDDKTLLTLPNPVTPWRNQRVEAERNRTFLFVGRLAQEKGPDLAARAARSVGAAMTFVGDGPMLGALQTEFPEFAFVGPKRSSEIGEFAARSRALIMPSLYPEPYGLVAVEAMWSGLPVLLPGDALLAREIKAHGAGLAFPSGDACALAASMRECLDDQRLKLMSCAAFNQTRALGLTPDAWAESLITLFAALLAPSLTGTTPFASARIESEDMHEFHGES